MADLAARAGSLPEGPVAMLVTPFLDNGDPDVEGVCSQAELAFDLGATGLALFGLAGEGFKLSESERDLLLGEVAGTNAGRLPLMAAVDHGGSLVAARRAERAVALGATAIIAMPPSGAQPSPDAIIRHFETMGSGVEVPLVVQDAPAASSVVMPVDLLARLVAEVPSIAGIKVEAPPTAMKTASLRERLGPDVLLYGGRGGHSHIAELLVGARGTMVGPAYIDVFAALWSEFRAGDLTSARARFGELLPAIAFAEGNDLYARTQKDLLLRAGVIASGAMRDPTGGMSRILSEEWIRIASRIPSRLALPEASSDAHR